ncbi:MAG: 3-phosphoserine/phosphohydroxythreonine transaminase [Actinomycetota bacterium]
MNRVHNFCAGPCTLPESVVAELADELPDFGDSGMSLIEMSHRDPVYDEVHHETMTLLRELCSVPDDFSILLLQGGASLQFAMVPMNLLGDGRPGTAGYVVSGSWGKKAIADAELVGGTYAAWTGAYEGFRRMPTQDELTIEDNTRYLHVTSNETIGGIRLPDFYNLDVRQVADMSSDYLTRPIPWDRFDVVYGGAQKNLGPAGLAVTFVHRSVLEATPGRLPAYLRFDTHADNNSLANTPPVFAIWATGKVLRWIKQNGGVDGMQQRAAERSTMVYDAIDDSGGFYRSPVDAASRSHTNIVFRLPTEELEAKFLSEAETNQLMNLKGHRSVGGIRASIYNALPTTSVTALTGFMATFVAENG